MSDQHSFPYLHGFSSEEQKRLRKQAEILEHYVYRDIDFSNAKNIVEVGCGVGAQTEILLRRFPHLKLTGIDLNEKQLESAKKYLDSQSQLKGRYQIQKMDAAAMEFESNSFDGAYLCWILEHVPNPQQVLSEVRRVLKPGGKVYINEVMNHSFFLDPYSPNVWKYWMAFNDYQYDQAGDPFIGAKLGNFLTSVGFKRVQTRQVSWHFDNRSPEKRKEFIEYWTDLMFSGAEALLAAKYVTEEIVASAKEEMKRVRLDPNAVFMYSFMQAEAVSANFD